MAKPDGTVAHAEFDIGGSIVMVGDETPDGVDPSPTTLWGSSVALFLYVEDVASWPRQWNPERWNVSL